MKLSSMAIVFLLLLSTTVPSGAQKFHESRGSFETQAGSVPIITFDGVVGTPAFPTNYPGGGGWYGWSATIEGIMFNPSPDPVHILSSAVNTNRFSIDGYTLSAGRTDTIVTLPPGMGGFAADLKFDDFWFRWEGENIWVPEVIVRVNFKDGTSTNKQIILSDKQFWGVTGKEITSIHFTSGGTNAFGFYTPYLMFDNVSIWLLPDLEVVDFNRASGSNGEGQGVLFGYSVTNGPVNLPLLTVFATIYWVDGPSLNLITTLKEVDSMPLLTSLNYYSQYHFINSSKFSKPPEWATHVLIWIDRFNIVPESDEANNVRIVSFPWVDTAALSDNKLKIFWNALSTRIEEADGWDGPWEPVFVGESSPVIITPSASKKFYRSVISN